MTTPVAAHHFAANYREARAAFLHACAAAGGAVVATLTLTVEWSDWRNRWFWWIQSVYVSPAHRRRGHYRRLHDHVVSLAARDADVCGVRLYVEHENRAAQATYRALGMGETAYRLYEHPTRRG